VDTEGGEVLPVRSGVMPDHVHLVSAPNYDANGPVSIEEIMQAIGAAAAHRLIGDLGRKGKVWEKSQLVLEGYGRGGCLSFSKKNDGRDAVLHFGLSVS